MDEGGDPNPSLIRRIEEVERERDGLRKDLEQMCLHQAGPSLLGVATRLHLQRTAGLEQEIDSLKKKLATTARENQNLHEELSEAYRIKGQLADLYSAEVSKNIEIEKQIKFFQGNIAAAFAERDRALMESEKAKEHEDAILQELNDSRDRIEEIESACADLWRDNATVQTELLNIKEKICPFEKIVSKFHEIRQTATGRGYDSWDEKCACLLNDSEEMWSFDEGRNSSTSQYIASLEENLAAMKILVENLQSNIRVGLEIEQHLSRKARSLEKKIVASNDIARDGILKLHDFHIQIRSEIMTILQKENDEIKSILTELQDKVATSVEEQKMQEDRVYETEQEDLNIPYTGEHTAIANTSVSGRSIISDEKFETSDALALALQEKVAALLLLSQQEERHLLERDLNAALQLKIAELQDNFFQVTCEKVEALMELANLKQKLQRQQENCTCGMKYRINLTDGSSKDISSQSRDGKLKDLLKKTYLRRWIGKGLAEDELPIPSKSGESASANKEEKSSLDTARSSVETTMLQESIINIEHLASSIHNLHMSLLKARYDATPSLSPNILYLLDGIILEADHIKVALGTSLPVSSSTNAGDNYIISDDKLSQSTHTSEMLNEKPDATSAAGFEMAELLILLANLLKENATLSTASDAGADLQSNSDHI